MITFQVTADKLIRVERRKPEFEKMEDIEEEEPQGPAPPSDNASSQFERDREGLGRSPKVVKPGIPEV